MVEVFRCSENKGKSYPVSEYLDSMKKNAENIATNFTPIVKKHNLHMTYGTYADALKTYFHPGNRKILESESYFLPQAVKSVTIFGINSEKDAKEKGPTLSNLANRLSIDLVGELKSMATRFNIQEEELESIMHHILSSVEKRGRIVKVSEGIVLASPYSNLYR